MNFLHVLKETRLIAILRGVTPLEVLDVADVLVKNGFKIIEVPLNSPNAFESIELLVKKYQKNDIFIGAGTVSTREDVKHLKKIGAKLVISPNVDLEVISNTVNESMVSIPGVLTPSEAYMSINNKANCIKLFPFMSLGVSYYNHLKTVIPTHIPVIAVGGIDENNIKKLYSSGIQYFGLGSSLYKSGMKLNEIEKKAQFFMEAVK